MTKDWLLFEIYAKMSLKQLWAEIRKEIKKNKKQKMVEFLVNLYNAKAVILDDCKK